MTMNYQCTWTFPTTIHLGNGRLSELARHCIELNLKRPLIVTDSGLANHAMIAKAQGLLVEAGLKTAVFSDVQGNPIIGNLDAGIEKFKSGNHDGVVAIGGGSGLDVGKLIALMVNQTIPVWDLEDIGDWWKRANSDVIVPIIAVPTTAGTGSEVGRAAVITNSETSEKKIIFHPKILPSVVIGDPELAVGLPAAITAATGMDAFTHSFEAYCVNSFHPMADGIAMESMYLTKNYLTTAFQDGSNIEARTMMFAASLMGAVAFQKGLGATHSIAHALGALYNIHHGLANAVILPYVMAYNKPAIEHKVSRIASYFGIENGFTGMLDWLLMLRNDLKIPHTLADLEVGTEDRKMIGIKAHADPSTSANPRAMTPEDMEKVFLAAVHGNIDLS